MNVMPVPKIVAHRGLHPAHPENTVEALLAAWQAGIKYCETDVRGSSDHEPFLMHDATLERTTAGTGPIDEVSSSDLRRLGVPALEDLVAQMPTDARMLVEIKPNVRDGVIRRTLDLCDPARCIIQSFDVALLRRAAAMRQDFKLYLLVDDARNFAGGPWDAVNAQFKTLDAESVKAIRAHGFGVGAWTVNEAADIERIVSLGADWITSDEPLRVRELLSGG